MRGEELRKGGGSIGPDHSAEAFGEVVKITEEVLISVREWCSLTCRCEAGTLTRELLVEVGYILRSRLHE